jgi:hypothetical protein
LACATFLQSVKHIGPRRQNCFARTEGQIATSDQTRARQLDNLLHTSGSLRTLISFYVLWVILKGIPIQTITNSRPAVKNKLNKAFDILATSDSSEEFENAIMNAWMDLRAGILPVRSVSVG